MPTSQPDSNPSHLGPDVWTRDEPRRLEGTLARSVQTRGLAPGFLPEQGNWYLSWRSMTVREKRPRRIWRLRFRRKLSLALLGSLSRVCRILKDSCVPFE